ncbi:threonine/serine ThrE exporter family protein [Streptosporangium sp. NBC_01756]|uniref:threonine/serine ThrE exporter family protein n=1 Tax=Streptosporangium sp. NBC_01756 TaxID=2975950 RepID=UPI002DD8629E|nr:threonine/serine exporter family protein [Streptosporangium sp. NBC_01756]WSC87571.1 threonine/serine exporter family protein [Streptosporangium sp. NBC_01756]
MSVSPLEQEPTQADLYRAMALALRVGELLLGSGEATETVSGTMRRITNAYGVPHCEADVNLSAITLSYVPADGSVPVTAERRVRRRLPDYDRLIAVHDMVAESSAKALPLDVAESRLREITRRVRVYPNWLLVTGLALVGASASILVGGGVPVAVTAFAATVLGDRASAWLAGRGVAEFFQLAMAAMLGSLVAVLLISFGATLRAEAVVVGAVVALLPGRLMVACVQDGIAGEYVTATARLFEVFFILTAIISGIGVTLYAAVRLGVPLSVENVPAAPLVLRPAQLLGAVGVTLAFAIALLVPPRHLLAASLGGGLAWVVFVQLYVWHVPIILGTAVSAGVVGLFGSAYARVTRVPSMVLTIPAIGSLLPGTALYRGMLELNLGHADAGLASLLQALSTALALGAGVILGTEILRAITGSDLTRRVRRPGARRPFVIRPAARRTRGY